MQKSFNCQNLTSSGQLELIVGFFRLLLGELQRKKLILAAYYIQILSLQTCILVSKLAIYIHSCLKKIYTLIRFVQRTFEQMWRGEPGVNIYQHAWVMLIVLSATYLVANYSPVVQAVSFWACSTMPVGTTTFAMEILHRAGSHLAQLFFHAAWERMTAKYPLAIYSLLVEVKVVKVSDKKRQHTTKF